MCFPDRRGAPWRRAAARGWPGPVALALVLSALAPAPGGCGSPQPSPALELACSFEARATVQADEIAFGAPLEDAAWVVVRRGSSLLAGPVTGLVRFGSAPPDARLAAAARTDSGPAAVLLSHNRMRAWLVTSAGTQPLLQFDALGGTLSAAAIEGGRGLVVWSSAQPEVVVVDSAGTALAATTEPADDGPLGARATTTAASSDAVVEWYPVSAAERVVIQLDGTVFGAGFTWTAPPGARRVHRLEAGVPDDAGAVSWLVELGANRTDVMVRTPDGQIHRVGDRGVPTEVDVAVLPGGTLLLLGGADDLWVTDLGAPDLGWSQVGVRARAVQVVEGDVWAAALRAGQAMVGPLTCAPR